MDDVRQWLKEQMQERQWTTTVLAEKAGVDARTIRRYIKGDGTPTMYTFQLLLKALGKRMQIVDN